MLFRGMRWESWDASPDNVVFTYYNPNEQEKSEPAIVSDKSNNQMLTWKAGLDFFQGQNPDKNDYDIMGAGTEGLAHEAVAGATPPPTPTPSPSPTASPIPTASPTPIENSEDLEADCSAEVTEKAGYIANIAEFPGLLSKGGYVKATKANLAHMKSPDPAPYPLCVPNPVCTIEGAHANGSHTVADWQYANTSTDVVFFHTPLDVAGDMIGNIRIEFNAGRAKQISGDDWDAAGA